MNVSRCNWVIAVIYGDIYIYMYIYIYIHGYTGLYRVIYGGGLGFRVHLGLGLDLGA